MKIIKKGKSKPTGVKRTCTGYGNQAQGCGAVLLVENSDLFSTARYHFDCSNSYFTTFKCPQCGTLTDLEDKRYLSSPEYPLYEDWLKAQKPKKKNPRSKKKQEKP